MKKQVIAIFLTALFILMLSACGSPSNKDEGSPSLDPSPATSAKPLETAEATPDSAGGALAERFADVGAVSAEENLAQFAITEVKYTDSGNVSISIGTSPDIVKTAVLARTLILDSNDYLIYQSAINCPMYGNIGDPSGFEVERDFAKDGLIIVFTGITAEEAPEFASAPMFYYIELGETPVVSEAPLGAADLFAETIAIASV